MNKAELVQAMADDTGLSKSDAEKALNAFVEIVGGELGKGGKVQLVGFGTYPTLNPQMKNWKSDRRISTRQRNLLVLPDCAEITLFGILVIRH